MKRNIASEKPVTKVEMDDAFAQFREEMKKMFTELRSDFFTRFDQVMGELEQRREDNLFIDRDIRVLKETDVDHEKRLTKLEKSPKATN